MRRGLHFFSVTALFIFSGAVLFVFLTAMMLPTLPKDPHPYWKEGFDPQGVTLQTVRFSQAGSEVLFDSIRHFRHPQTGESREVKESRSLEATSFSGRFFRPSDLRRAEWFLQRLLVLSGSFPATGEIALSSTGGGLVFSTGEALYRKEVSGEWSCLVGQSLPRDLRRLNESSRSLSERLVHPDLLIWADASVEQILREGIEASLFSEALLRSYRVRRELRSPLLDLLFATEGWEEVVRVILEVSEDGLFRQSILDRLEAEKSVYDRASVLIWVTKPEWAGYEIGPYLKDYLVRSLEEGIFDLLSSRDQRTPFERMIRFLDRTHWDRLGRVVQRGRGVSVSAAFLVLRHISGEGRDGFPRRAQIRTAKQWWERKSEEEE